jgi:hypothetical protein
MPSRLVVHGLPTPCSPEAARYGVDYRLIPSLKKEGEFRIKLPACKLSQTVTKCRPQLREQLASIVVGSEIEAAPRMFQVLGDLFEEGGIRGSRRPGAFRLGSLHTIALSWTDASIVVMNARADSLHATGWNSRRTRSRHSLRPALFSIVFRITL